MRFANLCTKNNIGCILWEWGPGNGFNDPQCTKMDMTTNGTIITMNAWAKQLTFDKNFGFKSSANSTKYMTNKFLKC